MQVHFISGLPRAGSTLLSAILQQNPRFHASIQSPVAQILQTVQHAMSSANESSAWISDEYRHDVLERIVYSYHCAFKTSTSFDSQRIWCAKLELIAELFPDAKVICMVRNVSWVLNSLEMLIRRHPLLTSRLFGNRANMNVYSRTTQVLAPDGLVGFAYNCVREAFWSDHADRLVFIPYEHLIANPEKILRALYEILGEEWFAHDFEKLEPIPGAAEFDRQMGAPSLHEIGTEIRQVPASERQWILPIDIFQQHQASAFWNEPQLNRKKMRVL